MVAKAAKLYLYTDCSLGGEAGLKEMVLRDALAALDAATEKDTL